MRELTITNKLLENKVKQLCSESVRLNLDVSIVKQYMSTVHGELLVTWQADTLTRLVEVIYERHGWRMPGEILVGDHDNLDRDTLSKVYVMAAKKIKKETVTRKAVGLSEPYYLALQRFDKVGILIHTKVTHLTGPHSNARRLCICVARVPFEQNPILPDG